MVAHGGQFCTSELNFHIWNANSQSFARAKVKPRWPPMEGNFVRSELNFHIWNANWPMKSEFKIAAHGGQFLRQF